MIWVALGIVLVILLVAMVLGLCRAAAKPVPPAPKAPAPPLNPRWAAMARHPAGKARTAPPSADRGAFWAGLGTSGELAVDREVRERADYELVKRKLDELGQGAGR